MEYSGQYDSLSSALADCFGTAAQITNRSRVSGGDINDAWCLSMSDGSRLFLKTNSRRNISFFRTEWNGLQAMREIGAVKVPMLYAAGTDVDQSFLLMEWIENGRPSRQYMENLGRALAHMHMAESPGDGRYGFSEDNYIGATVQHNAWDFSWINFFREQRLEPQIQMAAAWFDRNQSRKFIYLMDHLDHWLTEPDKPSLLHGDLWGGNVMAGPDGEAVLIDPAVYVGHSEADLAMTQLFGGFTQDFYRAYDEECPIDSTYSERRDLYNLYHMLNHLNLFGGGYLGSVIQILNQYV